MAGLVESDMSIWSIVVRGLGVKVVSVGITSVLVSAPSSSGSKVIVPLIAVIPVTPETVEIVMVNVAVATVGFNVKVLPPVSTVPLLVWIPLVVSFQMIVRT